MKQPTSLLYACCACGDTERANVAFWLGYTCRALRTDLSPCGGRLEPVARLNGTAAAMGRSAFERVRG